MVARESSTFQTQLWSLTLKALPTFQIDQLLDSRVLQQLVGHLLKSDCDIQQNAYPEILKLTQSWLTADKHEDYLPQISQIVIDLLFESIFEMITHKDNQAIIYSLAQGWVDIMMVGANSRKSDLGEKVFLTLTAA